MEAAMHALIREAEALCLRTGVTFTPPRRRVLELLAASKIPMKAYDLISQAGADGHPFKPPTVYRALEFLCQLGLVHRIEQDATFVACCHSGHTQPVALFVCNSCLKVTEVAYPNVAKVLENAAQAQGFQVESIVVEGRGQCAPCAQAA
ncbi:transcriptional repressor [Candidatus Phycosocius spiralis]|uniref:Ferric uptake regulation protein n=2 Tax=Candidatus Phycosocius spiralis TaxID=2815099 RepID=A0ABQ4PXT3_9PROT|nr:transcriptional repressor [Candidatus Phycosocius spiralis]